MFFQVGTVHLGNVNIQLSIFLVSFAERCVVMHGQQLEHVLLHLQHCVLWGLFGELVFVSVRERLCVDN